MQTSAEPRLSAEQVASYQREGYLVVPDPIFPPAEFDGLKDCFESILAALPSDERPEGMDVPHFLHPELFRWLFSDAVLDLVEPLLGPDIALFSSHFICKPRGNGKRVPWHEDSAYWQTMLTPMEVVTVWLAIDPSRLENGCMNVIPRTHDNGYSEYEPVDPATNVFHAEVKRHQFDENRAVAIELEPNHASLHDGRIIHGSRANTSTLRRCGYTMRYISAATKLAESAQKYHQIYLARGRDLGGNTYADPSVTYTEKMALRTRHGKHGH